MVKIFKVERISFLSHCHEREELGGTALNIGGTCKFSKTGLEDKSVENQL